MVNQIVALHLNHPVLVSMPRGAMRDIDPDAEHVHFMGLSIYSGLSIMKGGLAMNQSISNLW